MKKEKFKKITGFDLLSKVIEGIDYALSLSMPLKVNTVILKEVNDDEIFDLVDFARERKVELRFIEYMPLGGNSDWERYFVSEKEIKEKIKERYELLPLRKEKIAGVYEVREKETPFSSGQKIGFISTISNPFCNSCSRIRITSDGKIVLCLFDKKSYDIKAFLRPFIREEELFNFIRETVKLKPEGYIKYKRESLTFEENSFLVMRKMGG